MIYVIFGPTASGKTNAAIKLAEYFDAPIINADAFQIYQDMNIGTNKISKNDPNYFRNHLLDIRTPDTLYSVKEYQDDFRKCLEELSKQYSNIIVSGGTGLYIRAALFDYQFVNEDSNDEDYPELSNDELYEKLVALDQEAALKIHKNNRKRVLRAINLINKAGVSKSSIINNQEHKIIYPDVKFYFINPDREELYSKINMRVDQMIEAGLVEEVKSLRNKYQLSTTSVQAIGYKEILDYLDGKSSLDSAIELIKKRTRNYAKRQVTFFKNQFDSKVYSSAQELIDSLIKR